MTSRIVVWFSCGACSTLALKLAKDKYKNIEAVYCDTGGEHLDNKRYLKDVEDWLGVKIIILKNEKYKDHFDVYEKTRFLISPQGARCTGELKRKLRFEYESLNGEIDKLIQVFGYAFDEQHRAKRLNESFINIVTEYPLIDNQITKQEAIGYLWKQGIRLPTMYELGYNNNNCVGCVKGGKGYWNKIKKDFPTVFDRMARIERQLDIRINDKFLDELKPNEGRHKQNIIYCDFVCQSI